MGNDPLFTTKCAWCGKGCDDKIASVKVITLHYVTDGEFQPGFPHAVRNVFCSTQCRDNYEFLP